jgi:hypothetical protein
VLRKQREPKLAQLSEVGGIFQVRDGHRTKLVECCTVRDASSCGSLAFPAPSSALPVARRALEGPWRFAPSPGEG